MFMLLHCVLCCVLCSVGLEAQANRPNRGGTPLDPIEHACKRREHAQPGVCPARAWEARPRLLCCSLLSWLRRSESHDARARASPPRERLYASPRLESRVGTTEARVGAVQLSTGKFDYVTGRCEKSHLAHVSDLCTTTNSTAGSRSVCSNSTTAVECGVLCTAADLHRAMLGVMRGFLVWLF